jgi:DNA repair protein RadC
MKISCARPCFIPDAPLKMVHKKTDHLTCEPEKDTMRKPRTPFVTDIGLVYKPTTFLRRDSQIVTSANAEPICRSLIPEGEIALREYFLILMLNRANRVIGRSLISIGGMNTTVVDPKIVFMTVLAAGAGAFILCHNHPSGSVKPSQADIQLTKRISDGAAILDLTLLDHIILSADPAGDPASSRTFFSFADEGLL